MLLHTIYCLSILEHLSIVKALRSHWYSSRVYAMFSNIWYPKKTFFADFPCIFANLWFIVVLALGAGILGLNFPLFTSFHWIFCFSSQSLPWEKNAFVKQHIYHFIFGFRGNLKRVWLLELYSPVAWWKPANHSWLTFFRHGATRMCIEMYFIFIAAY